MNNEFDIDACDELIKSALNAREQLLAMQLKRERDKTYQRTRRRGSTTTSAERRR